MAAGMEEPGNGVCVVCAKVVSNPMISIHSSLISQNGSIYSQMGQVVGVEQLEEACRATELVCSICLRLLLNIVNLECKLVVLKNEFQDTFLQGAESRRGTQAGSQSNPAAESSVAERKNSKGDIPQAQVWDTTHLDECVRSEKIDGFFSNIPTDSGNNTDSIDSIEPQGDYKTEDSESPAKHETYSPESNAITSQQCPEELNTHLTLDTTTADLSDLLPPQCPLEDHAVSCSSQGEEETVKEEIKRSGCDTTMQNNRGSLLCSDSTSSLFMSAGNNGEAKKTCSTVATQDKHDSQHLTMSSDDGSKESSVEPVQKRIRRPRGKEDQNI